MNNQEYIQWDELEHRYWNPVNHELYKTIEDIPQEYRHLIPISLSNLPPMNKQPKQKK
jgi:hypothetical protein